MRAVQCTVQYNMSELDDALLASFLKVTEKSLIGAYKETREWEDLMYALDDHFVDDGTGHDADDLVDDEDHGFGMNVRESNVESNDE